VPKVPLRNPTPLGGWGNAERSTAFNHSVALGKAMAGKAKSPEGRVDAVDAVDVCRLTAVENEKYKGQGALSGVSSGSTCES
jgi:hypothetical protein